MSVNKVILVGNLGADPESRTTGGGTVVATIRLATSERKKDEGGQWTDHTEWHRVVAFGKVAENVAKYLKKGRQIYVEGRIRTRKWQDKEGQEKYTTEILADTVQFLGGGREGDGGGFGGGGGRSDGGFDSGSSSGEVYSAKSSEVYSPPRLRKARTMRRATSPL